MIELPATLNLSAAHLEALRQAVSFSREIAEPAALVATGSIIRGNPDPTSDLDIVILHGQPWRRRIQRWFNGTPAELFFNTQAWLEHSIRQKASAGRPVMAHMLATGTVLFDTEGRMAALVELSRQVLQRGPSLTAQALERERYAAACQVEDALDLASQDSPDSRQLFALAIQALVRYAYLSRNEFPARPKERIRLLGSTQPRLYALLEAAHAAVNKEAAQALHEAAVLVLGTAGFFEWDSGADTSEPPNTAAVSGPR